jgi:predicted metal-dependent peptidase
MESPLDNIAMDMSINSRLLADACKDLEFIPEGILPSSYPSLKLENCQSSLYYYNKLKEAKNNFQQNGTTGDQNLDDLFNSIQNDEPCNNPNHSTWEELTEGLSDIEKEILKRTITKRLQEIAEDCRSMGNGSVPSNINLEITKIERKVNWKALLRKFIGTSTDSNLIQNRNRPSKRFETNPSNKIKYKTAGVFLMDSSGSVSDDELLECNSELYHLHKAGGNIRYASWDGECEPTVEYSGKLECNRTKAGGTNIDCAIAEVNANYLKYKWNFAIITTDGHIGGITLQCKIPLLIVITKKGTKDFRNPYNNKVIQIN